MMSGRPTRGTRSGVRPAATAAAEAADLSDAAKPLRVAQAASDPSASVPGDAVVVARVEDAWGVRGALRIAPFGDVSDTVLTVSRRWWLRRPQQLRGLPRPAAAASVPASAGVADPASTRASTSSAGPAARAVRIADPLATGPRLFAVDSARRHSGAVVARLQGVAERDAAQALKGAEVLVSRADFPPLPDGEYYWVDLVGCAVVNLAGESLGVVAEVDDHGAHAILRVRPQGGAEAAERLIPFVPAYITTVDIGARRILVDWGLDY